MNLAKPKLLLHICCGVCGAWIPKKLSADFDVTLYFFNPNIAPAEEYERRLAAAWQAAAEAGVELIEGRYQPEEWLALTRGHENDPEGGERCEMCFSLRLGETAKYAKENNYQYFTSTLTVGRNKKAAMINPLGEKWARQFGLNFLAEDFKKSGGQVETDKESHRLGLYRQNYCGCVFSMKKS
ncbi:epoxyqueuosine reductase QueH [Patescibacteria group bacterium]|nr:epoxyqueuosine reductase QueH [Patescibacteria group bacterium]